MIVKSVQLSSAPLFSQIILATARLQFSKQVTTNSFSWNTRTIASVVMAVTWIAIRICCCRTVHNVRSSPLTVFYKLNKLINNQGLRHFDIGINRKPNDVKYSRTERRHMRQLTAWHSRGYVHKSSQNVDTPSWMQYSKLV